MTEFPAPTEGIVLTHFTVSDDVERSRRFYTDVLGGETLLQGEPAIVAAANSWIVISTSGPPTADKPTVIQAIYEQWTASGAHFLTPPTDRGRELRCYMRDPTDS